VPAAALVAAGIPRERALEGEIGRTAIDGPDPADPERAVGHLVELLPRPVEPLPGAGRGLPVVHGLPVVPFAP
jgi:hypothetical protein